MTQAVSHILIEVEPLSVPDRTEVLRAIVERVPMSDDLTDEEFAALASDMLRMLDSQEASVPERSELWLASCALTLQVSVASLISQVDND